MDKEGNTLDISKCVNEAFLSFKQEKEEIIKSKKSSIVFDSKRILIYASIIGLLQIFLQGNVINNFFFLTGATHILNNSLFPELVSGIAIIAEGMGKLLGGMILNDIYKSLFSKTKKYNSEKELAEDIINKEIEADINSYNLVIYDEVLKKLEENKDISQYSDVMKYETLKIEDDRLQEKYEELKSMVTKRRIMGDYIKVFSFKNDVDKDKECIKIKFFGRIFWWIQYIISSLHLNMLGLKSNFLLSVITYLALLVGVDKVVTYKNSEMMEVLDEKKLIMYGFNMSQDLELLKSQYSRIKQELNIKINEFFDLYYEYCAKQIAIEDSESKVLVPKTGKTPISRGIAPIDRSLETKPVVPKPRILRREDNG